MIGEVQHTSPERSVSFYWKIKLWYFNWELQDQKQDQWHRCKNIILFYTDFKILICDMWVLVWDQMLFFSYSYCIFPINYTKTFLCWAVVLQKLVCAWQMQSIQHAELSICVDLKWMWHGCSPSDFFSKLMYEWGFPSLCFSLEIKNSSFRWLITKLEIRANR